MRKQILNQIDLFRSLPPNRLTKTCPKCGAEKLLHDFPKRSVLEPRPNAYCFPCQREYSRQHYRRYARKHNLRRYANQVTYKRRNREMMDALLVTKSCVDCGQADPVVLEFDHVRGKKTGDISTMVTRAFSWKRICDEMAKCEVRCANCHRRRTSELLWRKSANGR